MKFYSTYLILDTLAVFLLLLFSLFMFSYRKGNLTANRLLGAALASFALAYMDGVFLSFGYRFHASYPYMIYATMSFDFLVGPLFYLFTLTYTKKPFTWKRNYSWHFVPFALHLSFMIYSYLMSIASNNLGAGEPQPMFTKTQVTTLTSLSNFFYFAYTLLVTREILKYHQALKNAYSNLEKRKLNWLLLICSFLFIAALMRYSNNLWWLEAPWHSLHNHLDLKLIAVTCSIFIAIVAVFKTMHGVHEVSLDSTTNKKASANTNGKYKTSALDSHLHKEICETLTEHLKKNKSFLQHDLSLKQLAGELGIQSSHLSESINCGMGINFYELINKHRLEYAAGLIEDKMQQHLNINQIMEMSGFSSKSVFNTSFKKKTGMTPSQYRRTQHTGKTITDT